MLWFKHDSNLYSDAKIRKLILRYGPVGYAVYVHCLELVASSITDNRLDFQIQHDPEIIADNLKLRGENPEQHVKEILDYCASLELFEKVDDKFYCRKMLKRLDSSMTSSVRMRKLINEAKAISHDSIMTHHDDVMINSDNIMINSDNIMQEKKRKEKNRIDKNICPTSPEATELSSRLFEIVKQNFPETKRPDLKKWAKEFDLILKTDKRKIEDVELIISKLSDPTWFWTKNIRSPGSMRGNCKNGSDKFVAILSDIKPEKHDNHEKPLSEHDKQEICFKCGKHYVLHNEYYDCQFESIYDHEHKFELEEVKN